MASDFALPRFQYLQKLLLVHGHWCYSRLANMILYFFYKNAMFVALIFWFQFHCGFSGSSMVDQWYLVFFNLMFSAFPQLVTGTLDKDVSSRALQALPQLYMNGQNSEEYKPYMFWMNMMDAFYQSLVCFFIPYFTKTWTWMNWASMVFSVCLFFAVALSYNWSCPTCYAPSNPYWTIQRLLLDPRFYLLCLVTPVTALLPRYFYRACQGSLFPSPTQVGRQLEHLSRQTHGNLPGLGRLAATSDPLGLKAAFASLTKPLPGYLPPKDQPKSARGMPTIPKEPSDPPGGTSECRDPSLVPADRTPPRPDRTPPRPDRTPPRPDRTPPRPDRTPSRPDLAKQCPRDAGGSRGEDSPEWLVIQRSDLSGSSWVSSTPLLPQKELGVEPGVELGVGVEPGVELGAPPGGRSQCVSYTRNREQRWGGSNPQTPPGESRTKQSAADYSQDYRL
ncbi:hypothetical protein NHX12_033687 [Muraenolepis orangiensis]|uniref:P-type ATPase C-terminal domain-containing protein n=1 Tax=Muraenolepis orangiensis TaxID=630683 RepID=A0A9Q0E5L0_9TELE|nr:hypothetical protein NHX12_033687 [Muraenolepis orangiensis]